MDQQPPIVYQYETRLERFKHLIVKYNINYDFAFRLRALEGFEIAMILDDSSSMRTPVLSHNQQNLSPFDQLPTRWDELKQTVSMVIDLASTLDPDGIDIYFLNRQPLLHVVDSSQLNETFSILPNGPTPLTRVLSYVLNLKRSRVHDRKLLILIATDGLPTDENGQNDLNALEKVLRHERYPAIDRIYVTFIACTDDHSSVAYLNQFDKKIPYVDVLDDYPSERAEVLAVQGKHFPFSFGDYVVKLLMGSVDQWFDQLDEKKVKLTHPEVKPQRNIAGRKTSCTIS
ncbi:unnamed protein product [Adineta steineri]|uniref:VWFA domain-containing protein n=1 Tax=Adineta steineri TaxID=433720 RepID=A0A813PTE8_9BILA|nr:unnamed protein product [Adineta steineri]CAF0786406.1 unnamed protein product [Adineta steineri]CAF0806907.1 unnamed protein product [Adineta steineri]CAF3686778.1 unnamed protein product [Adineta steineri]CAF3762795.1 unnamed protein product [Adineta steineri]